MTDDQRAWRAPLSLVALVATAFTGCQVPTLSGAAWRPLETGTSAHLRGLHVVNAQTIWASGSAGTVLRSTDGGASFDVVQIPGEEQAELRDVHAFSAEHAIILACQPARIYETIDGGRSFREVWAAGTGEAFLNALAFFDGRRGVAVGDAIDGRFLMLQTADGGRSWQPVRDFGLPRALPGEGGFAASGTCLVARADGSAWLATGIGGARVFRSRDYGRTWSVADTPLRYGPSAGGFSLAFRNDGSGVLVGGDYRREHDATQNIAISRNSGTTWTGVAERPPQGFRSCVVAVPGTTRGWLAVGSASSDYSLDGGRTWTAITGGGYHVVGFSPGGTCYAAGAGGRFARLGRDRSDDQRDRNDDR